MSEIHCPPGGIKGGRHCARCDRTAAPPTDIPYGGAEGDEIRRRVCGECWGEWLKMEVMVINELRLNFMDPKSQEVLGDHLRAFLRLDPVSPEMEQRLREIRERME